jgi:hypothetical protein
MSELKKDTTWRQFMKNPYLHSTDLKGKGHNVTIIGYDFTKAYSKEAGGEEDLQVMRVKEFEKPIVMSNRKAKQVAEVHGPIVMDSIGKKIHVFSKNEKFFGKWQDVLHFKKEVEVVKSKFGEDSDGWDACVIAFKSGKSTIAAMEKHYVLTAAVKKTLTDLIPKK